MMHDAWFMMHYAWYIKQYVSSLLFLVVFALFLINCGICTKQEMELSLPCFDISSHFLSTGTVLSGPSSWQDCPGWGGPPKAVKLGKIWGHFSRWMGASLVLRDSATPLKGMGLTLLLWVRRDSDPAQGERLIYQSSCALCTHCTAEILPRSSGVQ